MSASLLDDAVDGHSTGDLGWLFSLDISGTARPVFRAAA